MENSFHVLGNEYGEDKWKFCAVHTDHILKNVVKPGLRHVLVFRVDWKENSNLCCIHCLTMLEIAALLSPAGSHILQFLNFQKAICHAVVLSIRPAGQFRGEWLLRHGLLSSWRCSRLPRRRHKLTLNPPNLSSLVLNDSNKVRTDLVPGIFFSF